MKKSIMIFIIIAIVAISIVLLLFLTKAIEFSEFRKIPFINNRGTELSFRNELLLNPEKLVKLHVFENSKKIVVKGASPGETAQLKIVYWSNEKQDLNYNIEKGFFEKDEKTFIIVESFEARVPAGTEINIKQSNSSVMLSGLSKNSVYLNSNYLVLTADDLMEIPGVNIISFNGIININSMKVEKLSVFLSNGDIKMKDIQVVEFNGNIFNVNSQIQHSKLSNVTVNLNSGIMKLSELNIRKLSLNSFRTVLYLNDNQISTLNYNGDRDLLTLSGNKINSKVFKVKNSTIDTDEALPNSVLKEKTNTVFYKINRD